MRSRVEGRLASARGAGPRRRPLPPTTEGPANSCWGGRGRGCTRPQAAHPRLVDCQSHRQRPWIVPSGVLESLTPRLPTPYTESSLSSPIRPSRVGIPAETDPPATLSFPLRVPKGHCFLTSVDRPLGTPFTWNNCFT